VEKSNKFVGKKIADYRYLHTSALCELDNEGRNAVRKAEAVARITPEAQYNVIKIRESAPEISFLNYPTFFEEAFPILEQSWKVNLDTGQCRYRDYSESNNPPILHRKELLLPSSHPDSQRFLELTKEAESIGLFDDTTRIGFLQGWNRLLKLKGYEVSEHALVPLANETTENLPAIDSESEIHRHLTALTRTQLSAPMQSLARYGYLDQTRSVFDYGCGKGNDVQLLKDSNINVAGWDPYYSPSAEKKTADIVNLGFVINVIEVPEERHLVLTSAYELASEILVVSAMLENANARGGLPFRDGVRTSRNTFQKYFSQGELATYIESVLRTEPVPIAPGIFYAFKTDAAKADFLARKSVKRSRPRLLRAKRPLNSQKPERRAPASLRKYENNKDIFEKLWSTWLDFGRKPKPSEIENLNDIRRFLGSYPAALRILETVKNEEGAVALARAEQARKDDLIVQFAELRFFRSAPPRPMPDKLKKDVRHFFGTLANAQKIGEDHLVQVLDKSAILSACIEASEQGLGWLHDDHSLQLHTELMPRLPPVLRIYITCASSLFGDPSSADLVKIHIRSGKLSLMSYDDFFGKAIPKMLVRTKINLRNQRIDVYQYGDEFAPPNLYLKSRYMHEDQENYAEQLRFDEALEQLGVGNFSGFGPPDRDFQNALRDKRWAIEGHSLTRSTEIPSLDHPCGQYFKYRDLIECGETQKSLKIENHPLQPETYTALLDLANNLIDPIVDYFGMIKLTYGFCSSELSKNIRRRIAPKLDQHASHELNRLGKPICMRGGAAVDFIVEDEDMFEVSQWIAENLEFDRMYFYGQDRPIHVSFSETPAKQVTVMKRSSANERLIPRSYSLNDFINLDNSPI